MSFVHCLALFIFTLQYLCILVYGGNDNKVQFDCEFCENGSLACCIWVFIYQMRWTWESAVHSMLASLVVHPLPQEADICQALVKKITTYI